MTEADPYHPEPGDDFDWDDAVATLGDRLARAREAAGMNQSQLARRLGVKTSTLRNWEDDRSEPRANRLQMLSGLLNVSFVWLMTGIAGRSHATPEDAAQDGMADILTELQALRSLQSQMIDRTEQLERRIRTLAANG